MSNNLVRYWVTSILLVGAIAPDVHAQGGVASGFTTSSASTFDASRVLARRVTVHFEAVTLKQAVLAIAENAGVRVQFRGRLLDSISTPVTLHAQGIPLSVAMARVLTRSNLTVVALRADLITVKPSLDDAAVVQGTIAGRVMDAKTRQPLRGATIVLDGVAQGGTTNEDGTFRISGVTVGSHQISVRLLGYVKMMRQVEVTEGSLASIEVILARSTSVLDQVVVTGTIIPTELKAVPNAITVITAKQIEQRGVTKIDQLFRGDVPGLFAQNQGSNNSAPLDEVVMFSRGTTALGSGGLSAGTVLGTNPIKTYVDGVELSNPQYLSQIDPKSIERIEIISGPQASTIYGSNAINGVMQVFTKRGTNAKPQLLLNLMSGWVENDFSRARTPQHDYSAQLNGVENKFSYNAGGSWNYTGPWSPAKRETRTGGFGGARLELPTSLGQVTTDLTLRRTATQNLQRSGATDQTTTALSETGWYRASLAGIVSRMNSGFKYTLTGQTLGTTVSYVPTAWWSHELGFGQDFTDNELLQMTRAYSSVSDTTLYLSQTHTDRRSLHYTTTTRISLGVLVQATVTAGADSRQDLTSSWAVSPTTLTGSLTGSTSVSRQPGHNTGMFIQSQVGLGDQLFITYGVRREQNPTVGEKARVIPGRYGVAYTREVGLVTMKLRGSYGRSIRPPDVTLKNPTAETNASLIALYGNHNTRLANPDLEPEYQQGGEGGLELYLGTHGSLIVTRYNQTVDNLIAGINAIDSVRSLAPCPDTGCQASSIFRDSAGYAYLYQYQSVNAGSIRNQGWELQGSMNTGPLTTRGTYSWTKSRMIGITERYRARFAGNSQWMPGAAFAFLPEHTWAFGVTYSHSASNIDLSITGNGQLKNNATVFFAQHLDAGGIRLLQNAYVTAGTAGAYINMNAGYALADLSVIHHFSSQVDGVFQAHNLTNHYVNDYSARSASIGRQGMLGLRLRL